MNAEFESFIRGLTATLSNKEKFELSRLMLDASDKVYREAMAEVRAGREATRTNIWSDRPHRN